MSYLNIEKEDVTNKTEKELFAKFTSKLLASATRIGARGTIAGDVLLKLSFQCISDLLFMLRNPLCYMVSKLFLSLMLLIFCHEKLFESLLLT